MINSVSTNSQIAQAHQRQQHQQTNVQAQLKSEPQDSVVLSKQATKANDLAQGDPDHDGH